MFNAIINLQFQIKSDKIEEKDMKKTLSVIFALIALLAGMLTVSVSASKLPYSDVKEKAWYYDAVKEAYEKNYMEGKPGGLFAPNESVTRAQYVTILARLCNAEGDTDNDFKDVGVKKWYAAAVGWASRAGIVTGYEDSTFRGDNPISRQELMVMTERYLDYIWTELPESDVAVSSFTDAGKIAKWAASSVDEMRRIGLIEGDNEGRFNPIQTATRAEIATMTVRLGKALANYSAEPSICGVSLDKFTIYEGTLDSSLLEKVVASLKTATGVTLQTSFERTEHSIIFGMDNDLRMLEYSISENGGCLYVSVSTEYALSYLPKIFSDSAALRTAFNIPESFNEKGTYSLDSATECENVSYICETDKNPLAYSLGDSVTFRVSLVCDGRILSVPQFTYKYIDDAGNTRENTVAGHTGQLILTFDGMSKPGCGYLTVYAANRRGEKIASIETEMSASVAFDFYNITTAVEKPSDFDSFWDGEIAKLLKVEPTALVFNECDECKRDGFKVYYAEVQSLNTVASVHISYPENATPGSLKILAEFYGYGAAESNSARFADGTIYVSVNRHEVSDHKAGDYYSEYDKTVDGWGFDNPTREESYFYGMLMRDVQGIRFAEKQFAELWNGKDISVTGGSMGGFQCIAVAGLYDKVTQCNPSIPWMSDVGGYTKGRLHGSFFPDFSEGSKYYDSVYFAQRFKGSVNLYAGLGDSTCRSVGTISLYNAFGGEKLATFAQCATHGEGSGYNKIYSVSSENGKIDEEKLTIVDNGCAVKAPNYSADRELTASEQAMKTAASLYVKNVRWIEKTYGASTTIDGDELATLIKSALVNKCSLDASCNVEIDADALATLRSSYSERENNSSHYLTVSYTITDSNGGFYDATARLLLTKKVEE